MIVLSTRQIEHQYSRHTFKAHLVPDISKTRNRAKHVPREAVRIMSGFSEDVAIAVTQPLWPAIEPR